MAQRGMIAMTASCLPKIIIADEPTSSLDSITQQSIAELLKSMSNEFGISVIFITHDLRLASRIADRAIVLSKGRLVEEGKTREVFENPKSEAAVRLKASALKDACEFASERKYADKDVLVRITSVSKHFTKREGYILQDISLDLYKGETIGLVGESGCGKSTLARILTRLIKPSSGSISYNGTDIFKNSRYPEHVQMIFQDPFLSLDPHMKVNDIILEGARKRKHLTTKEVVDIAGTYLEMVGLDAEMGSRYPHQLSGGQCQRVSVARALVMRPELIVCDEPTSCLDTVSQAQILELFKSLKSSNNMGYLFISHDIRLLGNICDRIAVMKKGKIVETGSCSNILKKSVQPYTKLLIEAAYGTSVF
jgi:ABC-type glutathione transport system ATPase component